MRLSEEDIEELGYIPTALTPTDAVKRQRETLKNMGVKKNGWTVFLTNIPRTKKTGMARFIRY